MKSGVSDNVGGVKLFSTTLLHALVGIRRIEPEVVALAVENDWKRTRLTQVSVDFSGNIPARSTANPVWFGRAKCNRLWFGALVQMQAQEQLDGGRGARLFEPLRVLLVDDNRSIRRAIRQLLQTQVDIEVIGEAVDGIDAIRKTRTYRPDVILMDLAMPTMNGFEAVRQIKKESPTTQVLFVSQFDSDAFTREALAVGASGYILKSNASKQLILAVKKVRSAD